MRLVHKFLLMALLPAVLGGAAIMAAGLYFHRDILQKDAEELAQLRLEHHAREIEDFFRQHLGIMSMLVSTRVMQQGGLQDILAQLGQWESRLPEVEGLYYNEADGTVHDSAGRTFSSVDRFYYPAVCRGETVITRQITSRGTGEQIVLMLMPVFDSGSRRTGALGATVKVSRLMERISAIRVGRTGYALLVDDEGHVVTGGGPVPVEDTGRSLRQGRGDLAPLIRALDSGASSPFTLSINGEACRVYHRPIPPSRWSLALINKEAEALAPVRRSVIITGFMLAGTGLLVVIMAAVFHSLITVPVQRLKEAQGRIARGDLNARVSHLPVDEMGDLGRSLNDMAGSLAAAKAGLQESEALLRSQFDQGNIGIAVLSPGQGWLRVNPLLCSMLGYQEQELQGMTWEDITCPEDLAEGRERMEGLASGRIDSYEVDRRLLCRGGRVITAHAAVSCLRKDDGTLQYVIASFLDITERKREEEARELLTAILENTSDLVSTSDHEGRLIYMNRSGRVMLGWDEREDLSGRTMKETHPAWALKIILEQGIPEAMEKGVWQGETALLDREGREVPVSQVIMVHRSRDGAVRDVSTIMRDISESRRIQENLRESEEKFRTIFELAPFSIALTAMDGTCLDVNDALCQAHATVREKVIGRKMQENPGVLTPASPDDGLRLGRKLAEDGWLKNEEVELIRPGDGKRVSAIVSSRIITLGGKPAVLSMTVDVTERKRMEQQLAQAQKMEAVGLLAGGVAHDFNNLLQAILGYTELAMTGMTPGDPAFASMTQVRSAGRRAADLTRQLLAFSRRQVLRLESLDLNRVIADLMKMLRRLIGEDIELVVIPGHDLPGVSADRSQIEQVLMNLCINARDAMPGGGRLTIETEEVALDDGYAAVHEWARPGRYVLLSVSDSGTGMDQATIEQIFDPFFTTKEKDRGTGLGLATVYGIVRQHQGMVQVYSEPGSGSRFKVYLPARDGDPEEISPGPPAPVEGGTETVLLAEDDVQIRELAVRFLEGAGYSVLAASDGDEAVRVYQAHAGKVQLLLLDVVMPKKGGRAVWEEARAKDPAVRCLFASGYSENAIHTNFILESGMNLLQKPYSREDLLRAVRLVLDGGRA